MWDSAFWNIIIMKHWKATWQTRGIFDFNACTEAFTIVAPFFTTMGEGLWELHNCFSQLAMWIAARKNKSFDQLLINVISLDHGLHRKLIIPWNSPTSHLLLWCKTYKQFGLFTSLFTKFLERISSLLFGIRICQNFPSKIFLHMLATYIIMYMYGYDWSICIRFSIL